MNVPHIDCLTKVHVCGVHVGAAFDLKDWLFEANYSRQYGFANLAIGPFEFFIDWPPRG